ncbi:hypothetical protein DSECCO2_523680 [anaerobic digester metagenome]
MSPVVEVKRVLDERRQMEEHLRMKRDEMEYRLMTVRKKMRDLHAMIATTAEKARTLQANGESSDEAVRTLQEYEASLQSMTMEQARLEAETEHLHAALKTLGSSCTSPSVTGINRDTLLEALDDDAKNELYAEGARRYARRFADRVRDGEFD